MAAVCLPVTTDVLSFEILLLNVLHISWISADAQRANTGQRLWIATLFPIPSLKHGHCGTRTVHLTTWRWVYGKATRSRTRKRRRFLVKIVYAATCSSVVVVDPSKTSSPSACACSLFGVGASSFLSSCSPVFVVEWIVYICLYLIHVFCITSLRLGLGLLSGSTNFHRPCSHYYIFFTVSLNMYLTVSVLLLLFSQLCFPHMSLLLFLHSWSSQLYLSIPFIGQLSPLNCLNITLPTYVE